MITSKIKIKNGNASASSFPPATPQRLAYCVALPNGIPPANQPPGLFVDAIVVPAGVSGTFFVGDLGLGGIEAVFQAGSLDQAKFSQEQGGFYGQRWSERQRQERGIHTTNLPHSRTMDTFVSI